MRTQISIEVIRTALEMKVRAVELKQAGKRIGLIPTMGYLHAGHISLVGQIKGKCDIKIASIFVNPMQFTPSEDFNRYPRNEAGDLAALESAGVDIAYVPEVSSVYSPDFQTSIEIEHLTQPLCGRFRPGHFRGVTTIVLKLFNTTCCDVAVFGLKDFQQATIIRRMVTDLDLRVELVFGATVRERDGLAMSSRNSYLSEIERKTARALPRALETARKLAAGGEKRAGRIADEVRKSLETQPSMVIQYIEIVDPMTLTPVERITKRCQLAVAVFVGKTRLIDNVAIGPEGDPNPIFDENDKHD